jgi:hypothetical protein
MTDFRPDSGTLVPSLSQIDGLTGTGSAAGLDRTKRGGNRRDIIADYSSFGSSVYAPLAREGRTFDKPLAKLETAVKGAFIIVVC